MAVHRFRSTESAYDATQCDVDIKKGDILVIGNIIGVADTWPFAVTKENGRLHRVFWGTQDTRDWWSKNMSPASVSELLDTIKSEGVTTDQLSTMFANEFQDWLDSVFGFSLKNHQQKVYTLHSDRFGDATLSVYSDKEVAIAAIAHLGVEIKKINRTVDFVMKDGERVGRLVCRTVDENLEEWF